MRLKNNQGPLSLSEYLDENFIVPSGKTLVWWAQKLGLNKTFFHTMIRAPKGPISVPIIMLFAKETGVDARNFIRLQNEFLLYHYLEENGGAAPLEKIRSRITPEDSLVKGVLLNKFLRPMNIEQKQLITQMKVNKHDYTNFFNLRHAYLNYDIPGRLGEALGTGAKFWLDLQTKDDLDFYVKNNPAAAKYLVFEPSHHFVPTESNSTTPESPGSVAETQFLKPSKIALHHWADFFCMSYETFQRALEGRNLMDFRLISLLVKAFDLPASHWINLQNEYLAHKFLTEDSLRLQINRIVPKINPSKRTRLGSILCEEHLRPLGITVTEFGKYIGGTKNQGLHLATGHDRIGVEWAVKFSQSLGTTPMYWLDLQMEEDLSITRLEIPHKVTTLFRCKLTT